MIQVIALPWPDWRLSPNKHTHWTAKARATKQARELGFYEALQQLDNIGGFAGSDMRLSLVFNPPDNRRRDLDNLVAAMKAYTDGVFDALPGDDSQIKERSAKWGAPVPKGCVTLQLETLPPPPENDAQRGASASGRTQKVSE